MGGRRVDHAGGLGPSSLVGQRLQSGGRHVSETRHRFGDGPRRHDRRLRRHGAVYVTGKVLKQTGNYLPVFVLASLAYVVALLIVHLLVPKLEPAKVEEKAAP